MKLLLNILFFIVTTCSFQSLVSSCPGLQKSCNKEINQAIKKVESSFFKPSKDPLHDTGLMSEVLLLRSNAGIYDHFIDTTVLELMRLYYEERISKKPNQFKTDLYLISTVALLKKDKNVANICLKSVRKDFSQDYFQALKR
ncbi:MAG: hypothetical protein NTZ68_02270 [Candidatus Dependentiae bacterium]|nr:hypothetical protein [Candidatus Dependentiae bacterium]